MEVHSEKNEKYSVVTVSGKIDAATCSDLEDSLLNLIDDGETRIILDLADCGYISSAGLRVLLVTTKQLYGSGFFALCNLDENVSNIIEMAGFCTFINIFDDMESAKEEIETI